MELAPYYRVYELPWSPTEEMERRFRKVVQITLVVFAVVAITIPFLPVPEKRLLKAPVIPESFVRLIERKAPPPPPPPPAPKIEDLKPQPVPEQPKPQLNAQEQAKKAVKKLEDQLADLRQIQMPEMKPDQQLMGKIDENSSSERSMITSSVGRGSGGISMDGVSRGYGSGSGPLGNITTGRASSTVAKAQAESTVKRAPGSSKAARSEEEIVQVFDRNKGAIYAIYTRALRDNPDLKGKLVLQLTISPEGEITSCNVISSELGDSELERKLVARVKLFRFEARDVGSITVTKPIDFFPA